jgi:hypothetical protein
MDGFFYGIGIIAIGLLRFFFKGLRLSCMSPIYILVSGILNTIGKNIRNVSLVFCLKKQPAGMR